jgi:hypothetical protein
MTQPDRSSSLERDFYGATGTGPLTVRLSMDDRDREGVRIILGSAAVLLEPRTALALGRFVIQVAGECRTSGPSSPLDRT